MLVPTINSLGCLILILAPVGWFLGRTVGVHGVWMAYPISFFCALLLQATYFQRVWRRKEIRKLV